MNNEAVLQLYAGGIGRNQVQRLLDSLQAVTSAIERGEDGSRAEGRETSLLCLTLISLCTMASILVRNVHITQANDRAIFTAIKTTCQILEKLRPSLGGGNVYHNLLDHALRSLRAVLHPAATEIYQKCQPESSIHGLLNNLAIKLSADVFELLDFDDKNFENSKLSALLESLNCTLGSLNRALDPLPGGKYAMEAELYSAHLTPHRSPIVRTLISEPTASYCCCGYKRLALR